MATPTPTTTDLPAPDAPGHREPPPPRSRRPTRPPRSTAPPRLYRQLGPYALGALAIALAVLRLQRGSRSEPVALRSPVEVGASEGALRRHYGYRSGTREGTGITDASERFRIALPAAPSLASRVLSSQGQRLFVANASAVTADLRVAVATIATVDDGAGLVAPDDLATLVAGQTIADFGGTLALDRRATIADQPARVVELVGSGRRLYGWYLVDATNACAYQVTCVGADDDATRHACTALAQSIEVMPLR